MGSGMCMRVVVLAAALALLCQADLELPQRRRGLKQNPQASAQWFDIHSTYVAAAMQAVGKNYDVFVYGDSIVEALRGTGFGKITGRAKTTMRAWRRLVQSKYNSLVLGLAGDTASNLLWRIENGGGPGLASPKVVMVMIGTNDILQADRTLLATNPLRVFEDVYSKVRAVVDELLMQSPKSMVVTLGLLPINPPDKGRYAGTLGQFQPVVDALNFRLQMYTQFRQDEGWPMMFHDCSPLLKEAGSDVANAALMPGGIHVSGDGGTIFAECMAQGLDKALVLRANGGGGGSNVPGGNVPGGNVPGGNVPGSYVPAPPPPPPPPPTDPWWDQMLPGWNAPPPPPPPPDLPGTWK